MKFTVRVAKNLLEGISCYDCIHCYNDKCLIDLGDGELPMFLNCVKLTISDEKK